MQNEKNLEPHNMNYAKTLLKSLLQILILHYCSASDSLAFNQSFKDDGSVLVSNGGTFVLGFFSPAKSSSSRYLGIWFNFSKETVVWVANRDSPINDSSGVLSFNPQGNLVLLNGLNISLWSANVSVSSARDVAARILDLGNLVLVRNGETIWESFDHPAHALLSGMKLGLDFRKGLNRVIKSWKSPDDPGTGNCSLIMDIKGSPQLILYKDRTKWWRAGHWNGLQWGGIPTLSSLPRSNLFGITFTDNQHEITVVWSVLDPSIFTYIIIDDSGFIRQFAWQGQQSPKWVEIYTAPVDNCDQYARCGPYGKCDPYNVTGYECGCLPGYEPVSPHNWALRDGSDGCKRREGAPPMCENGEGFVKIENVKVPDAADAVVDRSLGLKECREECLRNCSCLGYGVADVRNGGTGCMRWYGKLMDIKQFIQGGQELYVRVDSIELGNFLGFFVLLLLQ